MVAGGADGLGGRVAGEVSNQDVGVDERRHLRAVAQARRFSRRTGRMGRHRVRQPALQPDCQPESVNQAYVEGVAPDDYDESGALLSLVRS
jgi:hypothetical protein